MKTATALNLPLQAYIIGIALGDGNLSNPNGRAPRLRVTCDNKYPRLISEISKTLNILLPENKIGVIKRKNCVDISCYSNSLESLLGWKASKGSKFTQRVCVPKWIKENPIFIRECLRGLFQTDGSIYKDRNYLMVNYVSNIPSLAHDVVDLICLLGYKPNVQHFSYRHFPTKYTIRVSRSAEKFVEEINLWKE